jgi:hypothetical protein
VRSLKEPGTSTPSAILPRPHAGWGDVASDLDQLNLWIKSAEVARVRGDNLLTNIRAGPSILDFMSLPREFSGHGFQGRPIHRDGGSGTTPGRACGPTSSLALGWIRSLFEHPLAVLGGETGRFR